MLCLKCQVRPAEWKNSRLCNSCHRTMTIDEVISWVETIERHEYLHQVVNTPPFFNQKDWNLAADVVLKEMGVN